MEPICVVFHYSLTSRNSATRVIIFYKDYFDNFFEPLPRKVKDKIDEVLFMFTILERIPTKFFKSIEGIKGLYEIRIE